MSSQKTQVLIARHGNTFTSEEAPRRVGGRTDLPLVESAKASAIGQYLKESFHPDIVFCSPLLRTSQTAAIALETAGLPQTLIQYDDRFIEIDYGPDENKPEDKVIARIGQAALDLWNEEAIVPHDWVVDVTALQKAWIDFFNQVQQQHKGCKVLVVTSNGIARFAPSILNKVPAHLSSLKMKTGHLSLFEFDPQSGAWQNKFWNQAPEA